MSRRIALVLLFALCVPTLAQNRGGAQTQQAVPAAQPVSQNAESATREVATAAEEVNPCRVAQGWQLYAKHRSGSLETFANQFRARNLAFSAAVFGLLALGMAFAFLSRERARTMGKLQLEFAAGLSHEFLVRYLTSRNSESKMLSPFEKRSRP